MFIQKRRNNVRFVRVDHQNHHSNGDEQEEQPLPYSPHDQHQYEITNPKRTDQLSEKQDHQLDKDSTNRKTKSPEPLRNGDGNAGGSGRAGTLRRRRRELHPVSHFRDVQQFPRNNSRFKSNNRNDQKNNKKAHQKSTRSNTTTVSSQSVENLNSPKNSETFEKDQNRSSGDESPKNENNYQNMGNESSSRSPSPPPLTKEQLEKHVAKQKVYAFFACKPCSSWFWKTVFDYKKVTRCRDCHIKLEAIPNEEAIGKGYYQCDLCHHVWTSLNVRADVGQHCLECEEQKGSNFDKKLYYPHRIGPSEKRGLRRSHHGHSCEACYFLSPEKRKLCKFRMTSLVPRVWSKSHESTGTTISSVSSIASHFSGVGVDLPRRF
ncbi:hypothetical protein FDP41_001898 [Naegleria fowleri]|uniref:3CxxC-type domain-containing protein n=1 Tax=Naegleria fowleri TaxID=5763 RepID=A0A6A5BYQ4_NAEFO|nr:uncharacterized protein FDP41_001898 [Naegleria fowleri]KAF0978828.1 hypothetical protein FDP41_001898 [Naegleria fowleri]CAG4715896.1 unnamed protein product [Naegleria fowleri]